MPYRFKLSPEMVRLRLPAVMLLLAAIIGCDNGNSFNADGTDRTTVGEAIPADPMSSIDEDTPLPEDDATLSDVEALTASASFAGGIPIGSAAQPNSAFDGRYNGALRNIYPQYLARDLSAIKSRGGKTALMMAGPDYLYKDADGHFSLTKWKARIDRYRNTDFDSYIKDGTLIGHYMIDEPNDPANWNGRPISGETLDEMARYSKSRWPNLPTIVRTYPSYLEKWAPYRYVDAAWAQYVERKGNVNDFIDDNVASAKRQGLALIVGLNYLRGGPDKRPMTASQVKSWGGALLSSTYPCAFISWKYNDNYLSTSSMRDAMSYLRNKAENRATKSCRGT